MRAGVKAGIILVWPLDQNQNQYVPVLHYTAWLLPLKTTSENGDILDQHKNIEKDQKLAMCVWFYLFIP